ncbi:hypothetical protein ACTXJ2_10570 [Psychrobacter alimentarius]|uniref:hypothetical protein n=1 Tax=Psychrobacter TaxID=497 RepID=UPI000BAAF780|nr:hypothetical protein [Psychrobacter sp. JB193]PAT64766.1 hypothetical protein CIK80_06790 [Psychrobacter sp. JB193]
MPMNSESLSKEPSAVQQRRQATMFLLRLQWVVILLLIAALLALYISQQRFQKNINERLQSNEHVVGRLNEMDDRIFAMSQQTLPEPSTVASSQAQNQLDLLRIQTKAADRLLVDNNSSAAIDLLRGLHWQLSQSNNEIAPALTVVIKQSLIKDIERLQAKSAQPSPWQLQNLAIQNMQDFLHDYERTMTANALSRSADNKMSLTRQQLVIHEVIMTLNLAIQASNMREREQLIVYLSQARNQLQTLVSQDLLSRSTVPQMSAPASKAKDATTNGDSKNSDLDVETEVSDEGRLQIKSSPTDIPEVIDGLDQLIANAPKTTPLLTTQILEKPQR